MRRVHRMLWALPAAFLCHGGWAAYAQGSAAPSWLMPEILADARAESALTVYSSMNEQEGLPLWQIFEDATGVKVSYVRSSDSVILARIGMENRARTRSW